MVKIGVLGAWSIDNTGDAIIGYATRRALRSRLPGAEVIAFAPDLPGSHWRHDLTSARGVDGELVRVPVDDLSWARELDALVIGGGGIINFAPAFRGFLLGDERWTGPPAAWNGVCSQNTPAYAASTADRERVRRCCEQLTYVSVRNATTHKFVRRCGFTGAVHTVPDVAFADLDGEASANEAGRFTIGVSVGNAFEDPRTAGFHERLFVALAALARTHDADLRLFPFGSIYGDERLHHAAAARLPGARVERFSTPLDAWRAIGDVQLYAGARLHAVIAACAQQVPFVAIDEYFSDHTASSKLRELVVDLDLEAHYVCPFVTRDPAPKLALAATLVGTRPFEVLVARLRRELDEHVTAMIRALGLAC